VQIFTMYLAILNPHSSLVVLCCFFTCAIVVACRSFAPSASWPRRRHVDVAICGDKIKTDRRLTKSKDNGQKHRSTNFTSIEVDQIMKSK
jgi:hypothetical protein